MRIQIVSDLHLELSDCNIQNKNNAEILILGGDIMIAQNLHDFNEDDPIVPVLDTQRGRTKRFRNFLKRVSNEFLHIIYIAGNHEYYHGKFPLAQEYLREECEKYNNIHFLENSNFIYNDINFVGATLWTDLNNCDSATLFSVQHNMNDYQVIRNSNKNFSKLQPLDTFAEHKLTINYFKNVLKDKENENFVLVGHHSPSKLSKKPKYENDFYINGAYSSDLSEFILGHPQIKLWTHGHTHKFFDYMIGSTRIVCNPRGYEGYELDSGWDPNFTIEIC
jgi:Icc-related predicted phosphoesterase